MADGTARESYRRAIARTGQTVTFRRVTGQAPSATVTDISVAAIFRHYQPAAALGSKEGAITMGLREFIVVSDDLAAAGFPLPLQKNDRIIFCGQLFNITEVDPNTRVFAGAIAGKAEAA